MSFDDSIPTLNIETFEDLSSILGGEFYELLNDFMEQTPTQLIQLSNAIANADFSKIYAIAHSQSGSSGNLGLDKFHTLCDEISCAAKQEEITHCQSLVELLCDNFEDCKKILAEKLNDR